MCGVSEKLKLDYIAAREDYDAARGEADAVMTGVLRDFNVTDRDGNILENPYDIEDPDVYSKAVAEYAYRMEEQGLLEKLNSAFNAWAPLERKIWRKIWTDSTTTFADRMGMRGADNGGDELKRWYIDWKLGIVS